MEGGLSALSDVATLDTCVTVIDAVNFMSNWHSTDTVEEAAAKGDMEVDGKEKEGKGADAKVVSTDEDERNIVDLLVEQVEFANVVVLNKVFFIALCPVHTGSRVIVLFTTGWRLHRCGCSVPSRACAPAQPFGSGYRDKLL